MGKRLRVEDEGGSTVPFVVLSRKQLWGLLMTPLFCVIGLLLIAGVVGTVIWSGQKENQEERRKASIGFVELLNARQAQHNLVAAGLYIDYVERVRANKELLRMDKSAPEAVQRSRRESIERNGRLAQELAWAPLIDTQRAIREGPRYKLPVIAPLTMERALRIISQHGRIKQA
jgi:hypothetical protein